jgi:hypothetical protein
MLDRCFKQHRVHGALAFGDDVELDIVDPRPAAVDFISPPVVTRSRRI